MSPSSSSNSGAINTQSSTSLKTYFKTPEGRYKLQYEKSYPSGLLHYSHGKSFSQVFPLLFSTHLIVYVFKEVSDGNRYRFANW